MRDPEFHLLKKCKLLICNLEYCSSNLWSNVYFLASKLIAMCCSCFIVADIKKSDLFQLSLGTYYFNRANVRACTFINTYFMEKLINHWKKVNNLKNQHAISMKTNVCRWTWMTRGKNAASWDWKWPNFHPCRKWKKWPRRLEMVNYKYTLD